MHRLRIVSVLYVPKMMCGHYVAALTHMLHAMDPSAHIEADLGIRTLSISSNRYGSTLLEVLRKADIPAEPILQPLG